MNDNIIWFDALTLEHRLVAGGKAASLGELTRAGLPVPAGFVLTTTAFTAFLDAIQTRIPVRQWITALHKDDLASITRVGKEIRDAMEQLPLPEALGKEILQAGVKLGQEVPVAIRSSATSEDSEDASFAGLQDTYLWVRGPEQILDSIRRCWASLYSTESISYRLRLNLPEDQLAMGVVVQSMVNSRCSGVMFTRSPTTGDRSVITLEGSWGLGSAVVSGEVTPDRFVINKVTREVTTRVVASKTIAHIPLDEGGVAEVPVAAERQTISCLSDAELQALVTHARSIEQHYGCPQDIEWAIDQAGEIRILQSRPETVWSRKEHKAAAKPAAKPFDHIFNLMGGVKK